MKLSSFFETFKQDPWLAKFVGPFEVMKKLVSFATFPTPQTFNLNQMKKDILIRRWVDKHLKFIIFNPFSSSIINLGNSTTHGEQHEINFPESIYPHLTRKTYYVLFHFKNERLFSRHVHIQFHGEDSVKSLAKNLKAHSSRPIIFDAVMNITWSADTFENKITQSITVWKIPDSKEFVKLL